MAQVSMNDFLLQYMMQMRIRKMDPEVMARYTDYINKEDFRGHMKNWRDNLMHQVGGQWVAKDMPDPNGPDYELNEEEWKKLFIEFRSAFRKMAADRRSLGNSIDFGDKNDKALGFLNDYFGMGRLFSQATASQNAENEISRLLGIITSNKSAFTTFLNVNKLIDYDTLTEGLQEKKYNTSATFQEQLEQVVQYISYQRSIGQFAIDTSSCDLDAITNGFTDDDANLTSTPEFQQFKGYRNAHGQYVQGEYDIMLRRLFKEEKIRNAFPSDTVKTAYNRAKELTGYDDENSKDYIPPKRTDELNIFQTMSKWADDTYEDVFEKYVKFKGDRLYFSPQAKEIVSAIHKAKIKPTDGLDKVMSSAAEIKKGILNKSPTAVDHFDWFEKNLANIKRDMPKTFDGALRNGRQMRALVSELIKAAVRDGKEKEAKTAMEVLSVIRYGFTTSKIMDTLKETDFTLFSDSKLSWNKNEGAQFVTKALDKSVKWAFMGIGYGITIAGNAISQSGIKFNGKRGKRLQEDAELNEERARLTDQTNRMQTREAAMRTNRHNIVNPSTTLPADMITESNLATHQGNLATRKANADAERARLQGIHSANPNAFDAEQRHTDATNKVTEAEAKQQTLKDEIKKIKDRINAVRTSSSMSAEEKEARIKQITETELIPKKDERLVALQEERSNRNIVRTIERDPQWGAYQALVNSYNTDQEALQTEDQQNQDLEDRLNRWDNATRSINELNNQITNNQNTLSTWDADHTDRYTQLMAYWDMLETGRDFHTGKMYNWGTLKKSTAQKNFDAQKNTYITDYLANYGRVT